MRDSITCECGCGQPTSIAPRNDIRRGYVKGQPVRFVHGHHGRRFEAGTENIRWKGDEAGRSSIHKWLNKHYPLTGTCEECGETGVRTEYSNNDHKWRRDRDDYRELCGRCHRYYDYLELGTPNPRLDKVFA